MTLTVKRCGLSQIGFAIPSSCPVRGLPVSRGRARTYRRDEASAACPMGGQTLNDLLLIACVQSDCPPRQSLMDLPFRALPLEGGGVRPGRGRRGHVTSRRVRERPARACDVTLRLGEAGAVV
ncbi:hypothetical protein J1605_003616 [Eschrichtius robustus]|uniref:Uncharacterized protein n=1 Tax=Eschrichtius robustus TaxID=9764 RepID=A0AB34HN26_ESCRO|nr:hypothetical protein J1605_003616 [Eschrichtius robustus]